MKVVAIIPARSGSKGLPGKNIAQIGDKTLLELAVNVGKNSQLVDDVFVSTDDPIYEKMALEAGASSLGLRPIELSGDSTKTWEVLHEMIPHFEAQYDFIVLLQPTSPVRKPEEIDHMIRMLDESIHDSCVTVYTVDEPSPFKMKRIDDRGMVVPLMANTSSEIPRQELPSAYSLTGAIYVTRITSLLKYKNILGNASIPYITPKGPNIDSKEDLIYLRFLTLHMGLDLYGAGN
jgi:CMP-N,N'-diacetyllegionaminic acid synthase